MDLSNVHQGVKRLKRKKRVGRGIGSGHGKTSTRGSKGQWASAGAKKPTPLFEGGQMQLFRRIPKRGFSHASWDRRFHVLNGGDPVGLDALRKVGLANGPSDGVRILGEGEVTKRLAVRAHHFSKSAAEKIAAKGGSTEVIPPPRKPKKNKMKQRPTEQPQ